MGFRFSRGIVVFFCLVYGGFMCCFTVSTSFMVNSEYGIDFTNFVWVLFSLRRK